MKNIFEYDPQKEFSMEDIENWIDQLSQNPRPPTTAYTVSPFIMMAMDLMPTLHRIAVQYPPGQFRYYLYWIKGKQEIWISLFNKGNLFKIKMKRGTESYRYVVYYGTEWFAICSTLHEAIECIKTKENWKLKQSNLKR